MRYTKIISILLIICFLFSAIVTGYYYQRYQEVKDNATQNTVAEAFDQLNESERQYRGLKAQVGSIIDLLSRSQSLYEFIFSPSEINQQHLENIWSSVAEKQTWYSSITLLDLSGHERLRIDYSADNHLASSAKNLQDLSHHGYVAFAENLSEGEVGVWGIALASARSAAATQPMLCVITPVTVLGERKGYLVLNVDIWSQSSRLNHVRDPQLTPELIGDSGFYWSSNDKTKLFGGLLPSNQYENLALLLPKTWQQMQTTPSGYVFENGKVTVYKTLKFASLKPVFLMIQLTDEQLDHRAKRDVNDLIKEAFFVFFVILIFALPMVSMALHYHHRSIESKLARAALNGMSAVMISDRKHKVMMVNGEFEKITGLTIDEIKGSNALKLLLSPNGMEFMLEVLEEVSQQHFWEGEVEMVNIQGETLTAIMRIQAIKEATKVSYYITSLVDITQYKVLENRLRELSEKDALTQLWNRRKFEAELQHHTHLIQRYPESHHVCLVLIDIDYFKRVNDEQGHDEGDRVIIKVGEILSQTLRTTDFLARIGGEEFAIIMPHTSVEEAETVLDRLRVAVEQSLTVTISAGFTDLTADGKRSYKCADIALYEAKTLGRNRISLCKSSDDLA
ncbi:diguanylate cyclase [Vibrio anguillarum]|uniref:diguanylate cyclase n=2 Tax=Vibrio anguillarum TaxID=55601 RepID=A0AAW4BBI8_VIBAN|nr:diguanylate cyclase [Vibrio anguillarum]